VHQPGLSADLDSFDLLDLVQVIQMTRRDLSLVVRAGAQRLGTLRFSQGELLWAEFGTLRGEEAFMALAAQHSGSVEEQVWDGRNERNVSQPLARLVMQAVEYRETHEHPQPPRPPADSRSRPVQPVQPVQPAPVPSKPPTPFQGSNGSPRLGATPPGSLVPEEPSVPSWVREMHTAPAESSFSSFLREEMAMQIPEPTVPFSTHSGGVKLSAPANGSKAAVPPDSLDKEDPPTVPLRSVQGGLLSYAPKRDTSPPEALREPASAVKVAKDLPPASVMSEGAALITPTPPPAEPLPDELLPATAPLPPRPPSMPQAAPSSGLSSIPPPVSPSVPPLTAPPPAPAAAPVAAPVTPAPVPTPAPAFTRPVSPAPPSVPSAPPALPPTTPPPTPPAEPKLSSMAILEQLAYGSAGVPASAEASIFAGSSPTPTLAPPAFAAPAPPVTLQATPVPVAAPPVLSPTPAPPDTEKAQNVQEALEAFAEQVGSSCIATAVIRSDGLLLAEYKLRRGQDQDLSSPAYHMAHVMQSSLRALLMGGWGDLEDTFISGSTHSVMLRRLGRAEKGLYHVAVLERSGNPGLCRVRMRNSEAQLLQLLSVDPSTATS
jgi:predicted regulator of Ras-like GTPase activity (Roadblock/LC7/MglB family)